MPLYRYSTCGASAPPTVTTRPNRTGVSHTPPGRLLPPYRDIIESTTGMCCPNIFGVRVPNNGAILTAAIGHQIVHVALPRHADERGVLEGFFLKNKKITDTESSGGEVARRETHEAAGGNLESPMGATLRR